MTPQSSLFELLLVDVPGRVQQRRGVKGWRKPPGAIAVGRGTRWGNPYDWRVHGREECVRLYRRDLLADQLVTQEDMPPVTRADVRLVLRGRLLMCWCNLDETCHADVLLEVANGGGVA